jgi:hypothetical protein
MKMSYRDSQGWRRGSQMDEYRAFVERKAAGNFPSEILYNRGAEHASVAFERLFMVSSVKVQILTGDFSSEVYGTNGVIIATKNYLEGNKEATIEILHEDIISFESHPWFSEIKKNGDDSRVNCYIVPLKDQRRYSRYFCVCDGKHFRLESDKLSQEAVVQFGGLQAAQELVEIFERIKKLSVLENWAGLVDHVDGSDFS